MDTDEDQERHRQVNAIVHEQVRLHQEKIDLQQEQIGLLEQQVEALQARLGKDSPNSHLPPSSDRFRRWAKSLRRKSDNKPSSHSGHPG